jgi:hypothetical protein
VQCFRGPKFNPQYHKEKERKEGKEGRKGERMKERKKKKERVIGILKGIALNL